MKNNLLKYGLFTISLAFAISCGTPKANLTASQKDPIAQRVDSVLKLMTLEEKVGQMNQYNGFYDVTGPAPSEGKD